MKLYIFVLNVETVKCHVAMYNGRMKEWKYAF